MNIFIVGADIQIILYDIYEWDENIFNLGDNEM